MNGGKGFIGTHSATDTLYEWPDYGRLVGAYFKEHPWTQQGRVIVEDGSHPAAGVRDPFTLEEEFYTFRENPRGRVQVLMRLDAASVGATGDYPLVWTQSFGAGRSYYNALGHFPATWRDARFQAQIIAAIKWAGEELRVLYEEMLCVPECLVSRAVSVRAGSRRNRPSTKVPGSLPEINLL